MSDIIKRADMVQKNMNPLSWSTLEFEEKERHPDWLWYAGLIFGIGATISFFYGNIFFGIFLIAAGAAIILFAQRKPSLLAISINEKEVLVNNEPVSFDRITQFWIDETGKPDKLLLLVKGSFIPMLALPLQDVSADTVRTRMLITTPEVFMRESNGTKIADRLGF